jgi:hypothetical protein
MGQRHRPLLGSKSYRPLVCPLLGSKSQRRAHSYKLSSCFISNIRFRRRVPLLSRHMRRASSDSRIEARCMVVGLLGYVATEWIVETRSVGACVVRVVHSMYASAGLMSRRPASRIFSHHFSKISLKKSTALSSPVCPSQKIACLRTAGLAWVLAILMSSGTDSSFDR